MQRWLIFLLVVCSGPGRAETPSTLPPATQDSGLTDRSLWEVGIVGAGSYLPDYPAADQNRFKWIAAPYGVYRGKIMRADRDGARARFLHTRNHEIDLGVAASFATRSKDNQAREGMPDLDYLLELGPRVSVAVARLGDKGKLRVFVPVRAVFSTDLGNFHHRGYTATPALHARWPIGRSDWLAITQLTATFGDRQICAYFYDVPPAFSRINRPFYDARAGYIGTDLFGGILVPTGWRTRLFAGAQVLQHSGAANESSPLFRSHFNYSLAAGLVWTFYRSTSPAVTID